MFIKNIKRNIYLFIITISFVSCTSKNNICCSNYRYTQEIITDTNLNINNQKEVLIGTANADPNISINNIGNGIIVWNDISRKIINYIPETNNTFINDNLINPVTSVDSNGNGLLVWILYDSNNNSDDENKVAKLYGIKLKEYVPIDNQFLITDMHVNKFKIHITDNGNGLLIWQTKDKKIYSYDINNLNLLFKLKSIKEFDNYNIEDLYISEQNSKLEIKSFEYKLPEGYLFSLPPKLDLAGNGYISWVNKEQDLVFKKINSYKADESEVILSKNITNQYSIELYSNNGFGIVVWLQDRNLFYKSINSYIPSFQTEKLNINEKEIITSIQIKLNEKGRGMITWRDSLNDLYFKKIVLH